jgi:hypothetical protein
LPATVADLRWRTPLNATTNNARARRLRRAVAVAVVAALVATAAFVWLRNDDAPEVDPELVADVDACDVPVELLERAWNGYYPGRSGDIITIEQFPAIYGNRHSTPWPYTQDIPLFLYGPGFIKSGTTFDEPVTVADLAPTFAELLDFRDQFGDRDGRVLREALLPEARRNGKPRLIFTLIWDGGGDNVLERWPDAWPELQELMDRSANYAEATVGSSPSITPTVHATIGTGDFPKKHGMPDTKIRIKGTIVDSWQGFSPRYLERQTLGDMWDLANDNEPLVGLFARDSWHGGMIGHGAQLEGGDADLGVFDDLGNVNFRTRTPFYYMPEYLENEEGLQEAIDEIDLRDGEDDDEWLGNQLLPYTGQIRYGPPWPIYQTDRLLQMLRNEKFGADEMPDLFYTNYKSSDLAGHYWNMEEPEMRDVIREQDRQIPRTIAGLDRLVGKDNYVLAFTADHGQTPYARVLDGWRIEMREMTKDLRDRFDKVTPKRSVIHASRGYYLWLDEGEMKKEDVTAEELAAYIRNYRIGDNVSKTNKLTRTFEARRDQRLYLTALTPEGLEEALACARKKQG